MIIAAITFTATLVALILGYVAFNAMCARLDTLNARQLAADTRAHTKADQRFTGRNEIGVN